MSTKVEFRYPRAPITVITHNGRPLGFEVADDGSVEIVAEVDDLSGWSGPRTAEAYFTMTAEDWAAVVAHIAKDSVACRGTDRGSDG